MQLLCQPIYILLKQKKEAENQPLRENVLMVGEKHIIA